MSNALLSFDNLDTIATHLQDRLEQKKYILLFAYNGTGKTRLSMAFKELGKQSEEELATRDTLYFNAFTEDLFSWDNDLGGDAQLAVDEQEAYAWVQYFYIDDPISSLDDKNAIAVASHLAQLLKSGNGNIRTVISTHHHLFFNVMCNELSKAVKYFVTKEADRFLLTDTGDTSRYHHVALLKQLHEVAESGEIYTYHFNILRSLLEKTATFHGFRNFSACIKQDSDDSDGILHARLVNVLSHGNYSLYEPRQMLPENKDYFRRILRDFMESYRFNPELFPTMDEVNL